MSTKRSLFFQRGCAELPSTTAEAVSTVMGYNCSRTIGELLAVLQGRGPSSLRALTPFDTVSPLSEAYATPYLLPLPLVLSGGKQLSIMRDVNVQVSPQDVMMNPVPAYGEDYDVGPDVFTSRSITLTLGVGEADNFPFISIPMYTGTAVQGIVAWQRAIGLLGVIYKITWTEGDDSTYLSFGRKFTNVPGSTLELARVIPQDENCRQLSFFVPFASHNFEAQVQGTTVLRYYPNDYLRYFEAGDDFISVNPSLMPWTFEVRNGSGIVTTGYSWSVEAIPVPLSSNTIQKLWPMFNGRSFTKD